VEAFVLPKAELGNFVAELKKDNEVLGPVAKGEEYIFAPVDDVKDLCLDYDTTILPPAKKFIHMPGEVLFEFEGVVEGKAPEIVGKRVLLGVHACDLNGLLSLDKIFLETYPDAYYKARRENTAIIALNCVSPCTYGYCASFNTGPSADIGFDLCLTDLGDKYFVEVGSDKGREWSKGSVQLPMKTILPVTGGQHCTERRPRQSSVTSRDDGHSLMKQTPRSQHRLRLVICCCAALNSCSWQYSLHW